MEIAIRRAAGSRELRQTQPYDCEGQLRDLLGAQPNLIPLHQLGDEVLAPRVAVRELTLRVAGFLDLRGYLASSANGQRLVLLASKWHEKLPEGAAGSLEVQLGRLPDAP